MPATPQILARGPWHQDQVHATWSQEEFAPSPEDTAAADVVLQALRDRGSPSQDGLAARLADFDSQPGRLTLSLQPARWALRLLPEQASRSLTVLCVVRSADGRWLAGRRAAWVASWAGRWALGAGGSVELGENPAEAMVRELGEEWSVAPERLSVEALVQLPSGLISLIGLAWLPEGATVTPDAEHDEFAWWPAAVTEWPEHADAPLRLTAMMLDAGP